VPNVSMNPTLEAIQEAINSTAKTILQVGTRRACTLPSATPATYFAALLAASGRFAHF